MAGLLRFARGHVDTLQVGHLTVEDIVVFLSFSPLWLGLLLIFREGRRLRYLGRPLFRSWRTVGTVSEYVQATVANGVGKSAALITFTSEWGSTVRYVEPPLRRGSPPAIGTEVKMCHRLGDEKVAKRYDRSRQLIGWFAMLTSGPMLLVLFANYWPLLAFGAAVILLNSIRRKIFGRPSSTINSAFQEIAESKPSPPTAPSIEHEHTTYIHTEIEHVWNPLSSTAQPPSPVSTPRRPSGWMFAGLDANAFRSKPSTDLYPADPAEVARVKELTASLKPALRNYAVTMFVLSLLAGTVQGPLPGPPAVLLFLLVGFFILWQAQPFPDGRTTTGRVVAHVARSGSEGGTVYANTIEFETDAGPSRFTTSTASSKRTPIGTERTVSYRPYDLNQARCTNGLGAWMGWIWTIFSVVMGMAFNWMVWPPLALVAGGGAWLLHQRYVKLLQPTQFAASATNSPLIS